MSLGPQIVLSSLVVMFFSLVCYIAWKTSEDTQVSAQVAMIVCALSFLVGLPAGFFIWIWL